MKAKGNLGKWGWVTLLVVVASVVSVGFVFVEDGPPLRVATDSRVRFDEYLFALELAEAARNAALETPPLTVENDSRVRFDEYLFALEQSEAARNAALSVPVLNTEWDSWTRFEAYLFAHEQMEVARDGAFLSLQVSNR